jgi:hypothetical protein
VSSVGDAGGSPALQPHDHDGAARASRPTTQHTGEKPSRHKSLHAASGHSRPLCIEVRATRSDLMHGPMQWHAAHARSLRRAGTPKDTTASDSATLWIRDQCCRTFTWPRVQPRAQMCAAPHQHTRARRITVGRACEAHGCPRFHRLVSTATAARSTHDPAPPPRCPAPAPAPTSGPGRHPCCRRIDGRRAAARAHVRRREGELEVRLVHEHQPGRVSVAARVTLHALSRNKVHGPARRAGRAGHARHGHKLGHGQHNAGGSESTPPKVPCLLKGRGPRRQTSPAQALTAAPLTAV